MNTQLDSMAKEKQLSFNVESEFDMSAQARINLDESGESYFSVYAFRRDPEASDDRARAKCSLTLTAKLRNLDTGEIATFEKTRSVSLVEDLYDSLAEHLLDLFPTVGSLQKWVAARELEQLERLETA